MKFRLFIDKSREEEVIVYAHEASALTAAMEKLALGAEPPELVGYSGKEAVLLSPNDVFCFVLESSKLYAVTEKEKLQIRQRLYQIEEMLPAYFVKINQSCIANINKIERFDASVSGTMTVIFKNSHRDFVSRRSLKHVKERIGL